MFPVVNASSVFSFLLQGVFLSSLRYLNFFSFLYGELFDGRPGSLAGTRGSLICLEYFVWMHLPADISWLIIVTYKLYCTRSLGEFLGRWHSLRGSFGSTSHGTVHCEMALDTLSLPTTPHAAVSSLVGSSILSYLFFRDHCGNMGLLCLPPSNSKIYCAQQLFFRVWGCIFYVLRR